MKLIRLITLILFMFQALIALGDEKIEGVSFRSYEYTKDERTSLIIPSEDKQINYDNYFSLSFDIKVRERGEHFGYICRLILGDSSSLNLLLVNPIKQDPYLCFIKDQQYLGKIQKKQPIDIHGWNTIKLEIIYKNDSLFIKNGEALIFKDLDNNMKKTVRICFGANRFKTFETSDVAPIILKNVAIGLSPHKIKYHWPLKQADNSTIIYDENKLITAYVCNPEWDINNHLFWKHVKTLPFKSKTFPVPCENESSIYFIEKNCIHKYDLRYNTLNKYTFSPSIDISKISNQFIFIPVNNSKCKLVYYDFEESRDKVLSYFDFLKCSWSIPIQRVRHSSYVQHNRFFNHLDSSIVQMFGYGFHTYKNDMNRITLKGNIINNRSTDIISPRYLSAVGKKDSLVYIYGGVGNQSGKQEFGIYQYRDLYTLNLSNYAIEKKWTLKNTGIDEVVASTLILSEDGKHAKGLFFSPNRSNSSLILKDINIDNGIETALGDTIPYMFLDVCSHADLMFLSEEEKYYAVTVHHVEGENYEGNIYSIEYPVLPLQHTISSFQISMSKVFKILSIVSILAFILFLLWKLKWQKKSNNKEKVNILKETVIAENYDVNESDKHNFPLTLVSPIVNTKPGIYLLNGFQVINIHSQDITGKFTPIMRQLLSAIILYSSNNKKGISNVKLKELFWFDKSEESFSNNRSVNIRKIRLLLEEVGEFEISSANGYWSFINKGNVYNDYIIATKIVDKIAASTGPINDSDLSNLLEFAACGQLLPNIQFEWLDNFKATYTDSMIDVLSKLRDSNQFKDNDYTLLQIANSILKFDSLDEESVRMKCKIFISLKRTGLAHNTYEQFIKEYHLVLNEEYNYSFEDFVSR